MKETSLVLSSDLGWTRDRSGEVGLKRKRSLLSNRVPGGRHGHPGGARSHAFRHRPLRHGKGTDGDGGGHVPLFGPLHVGPRHVLPFARRDPGGAPDARSHHVFPRTHHLQPAGHGRRAQGTRRSPLSPLCPLILLFLCILFLKYM